MSQFGHFSNTELLDMLAMYTTRYTQLLTENDKSEDFYRFKRQIELLTAELESRRLHGDGKRRPTSGNHTPSV